MATYEYRCGPCDDTFEVSRPMAEADAPTVCPLGHADTKRLLSVFASTGGASPSPWSPVAPRGTAAPSMGGGGCCGGACGCG